MVEDENLTEEDVVKKLDAITTKAKFRAFGQKSQARRIEDILKASQGLDDEVSVKELMRKQYDSTESEIN